MKNLFKTMMLVAVAAMGFTACSNEAFEEVNPAVESKTYTMTFVADAPNTRTSVSIDEDKKEANYSWSDGDVVAFIQSAVGAEETNKTKSKSIKIEDGKATFTTDFKTVEEASAYNYGAYYPDQEPPHDKTFNNVVISLASSQDLTKGTFDPNADLLMSKPILNVKNNDHGGSLEFTRLAAVGKMNLKGVNAGETIKKVVITFEEEVVNGDVTLDFEKVTATYAETGSNTITLQENPNNELTALAEGTPIFFTCFPGEYSGAYSVEVTTDKATYTKNGDIKSALPFVAGDVTAFNLTVGNRTEPDESGEVTIVASEQGIKDQGEIGTLTDGPITVAFNKGSNNNAAKYFDNGKAFRVYGGNTFTVSSEKTILSIALTFASGEGTNAITTDVESYSNGTWTGSENSVTFTIGGTSGHRRIASMTITYGKPDTREKLGTPKNVKATAEDKNVTVTWDPVANAGSYTLTISNGTETLTKSLTGTTHTFVGAYSTTYNFSVVAVPKDTDTETYKKSDAGTAEVTTKADPTAVENTVVMNIFANKGTTGTKTISWTSGDVTVTNDKAGSNTAIRNSDSDHYRVYQNSKLTISVASGTISKVVITCTENKYVSPMQTSFKNAGYTVSTSGNNVTVTGNGSAFTMTASAQTRLNKVEVTYAN